MKFRLLLGFSVMFLYSCTESDWLSMNIKDDNQNLYHIETLMKKDATHSQGMSVANDKIFVLHENGQCRVYDYKSRNKTAVGAFDLACKSGEMHYNCANFGAEQKQGADFPLLYVTNGTGGVATSNTCFVESISQTSESTFETEVVQVINLHAENFENVGLDKIKTTPQWLVDKERHKLWCFSCNTGTTSSVMGDFSESRMSATCFELPTLADGDSINLDENDVVKQVLFEADAYVIQGGCIRDGIIYYSYGYGGGSNCPSRIRVYNTDTGRVDIRLDLDNVILNELEDLAYYDNRLIVNVTNGVLYSIDGKAIESMRFHSKSRTINNFQITGILHE